MRLALSTVVLSFLAGSASLGSQAPGGVVITPTDSNIVFGNVANASLLMDVFRPSQPNGIGIIFISGGGWGWPDKQQYFHDYDDPPLRKDAQLDYKMAGRLVQGLVARGYTVFSIDNRFVPETHFPGIFYDAQRAVRFIRASAARYGIDPQKLGAIGHSSGAHLASLLGVKDTVIDDPKHRPYQQGSSQVQAVVDLAGPMDMSMLGVPEHRREFEPIFGPAPAASPITFVTARSAPMLIYQGEKDPIVLKESATMMAARLKEAGVPYQLNMRPNQGHSPDYDLDEIDAWFRRFLK